MKKYCIIIIVLLSTLSLCLSAVCLNRGKKIAKFEKIAAEYMRYYNSSEELYDLLEKEGVLEPYLESEEGSKYLEELNTIRKANWDNNPVRMAKMTLKK